MQAPTRQMMRLARAFTSGLTPSLTFEKITIGSVLAPGPETKLEITRSSSDKVKLSSQLDARAGAIPGSVVSTKARTGPDPKSMAASSSERSAPCRRDWTVMVTYAVQNAMCAMTMVVKPRCGQPKRCSIDTNSRSWVIPVMISGITSGALTMPVSSNRPRKSPNRTNEIAASVPRITDPVDTTTPIFSDSQAASRIWSLCSSWAYQLVENPPQTLTSADALKE